MSSADFNKLVGAILVSVLAAIAIGIFINGTLHPHMPSGDEMAYKIDTGASETSATTAAPAAPTLDPVAPLLAAADPGAGKKLAGKRCASCHSFDKGGANKVGPNLYGVAGADLGAKQGFSYSKALTEKGGAWDYAALNAFLAKPKDFIRGTKMSFLGFKSVKDRASVIAYLRALSDNPPPLP